MYTTLVLLVALKKGNESAVVQSYPVGLVRELVNVLPHTFVRPVGPVLKIYVQQIK
jgi:hypothetical protein